MSKLPLQTLEPHKPRQCHVSGVCVMCAVCWAVCAQCGVFVARSLAASDPNYLSARLRPHAILRGS